MSAPLYLRRDESLFLQTLEQGNYTRSIILADAKTNGFCVPVLKSIIPRFQTSELIVIPDGERNKTLSTLEYLWQEMLRLNLTKKDLVLCLGGGVLTDMGALACTLFKRGIPFVLIPTTLIGMVDAAIGGKTAIDFSGIKNLIGSYAQPVAIYIQDVFLNTLSIRQKKSGIAEQLKHALLQNEEVWALQKEKSLEEFFTAESIRQSAEWKWQWVQNDLYDIGLRQALNLGHSIGHAIESYSLQGKHPLLHGEAIMYGLAFELKLSQMLLGLPEHVSELFLYLKAKHFPELDQHFSVENLLPYLLSDKKNDQLMRFSLLEEVGKPVIQVVVSTSDLNKAFAAR